MTKKKLALTLLAVCLITVTAVVPAMAYFTAHKTAQGSLPVTVGTTTTIDEQVKGFVKTVTIANSEESGESVWVRARAYAPATFNGAEITLVYSGGGWTAGEDDWYYYEKPLAPGEKTDADSLKIEISGVPKEAAEGNTLHVAVVYETTKVLYDEDGSELEADWDLKGETGDAEEEPADGADDTTEGGGN